jgi:tetratricopeptide (TPR) repeat protein
MDSLRVGGSDADRVQGLCERVDLLLDLNRPQEALPLVAKALTFDPTSITAHCQQARVWKALGDVPTALKAAEAAIALDPQEEWGHRLRALILLDAGKGEEALEAALEAVRLDPERSQVLQCVVQCATATRRHSLARIWAERGRDLYPGDATFHSWLGSVSINEGNWSEAETHLRRSLEIDPTCHASAFNLGLVLKYRERRRDAIAAFYQAAQLAPTDPASQKHLYSLISESAKLVRALALVFAIFLALVATQLPGMTRGLAWSIGLVAGVAMYAVGERWWLARFPKSIGEFYQRRRWWELRKRFQPFEVLVGQYVALACIVWLCLLPILVLFASVRFAYGDWRTPLGLVVVTATVWKLLQWAPKPGNREDASTHGTIPAVVDPTTPDDTPWDPAPLVQLRVVAYASPQQVDAAFGSPRTITPVLPQPELMPGEYREYLLADQGVLWVRFFYDQAVSFNIWTERGQSEDSSAALAAFFGLEVAGLTTWRSSATEHAWAGMTGGLSFSRLWVGHKDRLANAEPTDPSFNAAEAVLQPSRRKN